MYSANLNGLSIKGEINVSTSDILKTALFKPNTAHSQEKHNESLNYNFFNNPTSDLSSVELNFLLYVNGRSSKKLKVPNYWRFDYNVNTDAEIKKLINGGYLYIPTGREVLKFTEMLKVADLKVILKKYGVKTSGTKAALIQRLKENIPENALVAIVSASAEIPYCITKKGLAATQNIAPSALKNLELEDLCIKHILNKQLSAAYTAICKWQTQKQFPQGINVDWAEELSCGLPKEDLELYNEYISNIVVSEERSETTSSEVFCKSDFYRNSSKHKDINSIFDNVLIKAIVVFAELSGIGINAAVTLYERLSPTVVTNREQLADAIIYGTGFISTNKVLRRLKQTDVMQYSYCAALDCKTCPICGKLDGKIFKVSTAKFGVNLPPMHNGCRCCILPYYDDKYFKEGGTRAARDKNGKTCYVPGNMTYSEWLKTQK